jgi:hypothetical protein
MLISRPTENETILLSGLSKFAFKPEKIVSQNNKNHHQYCHSEK